MVTIFLTIAGLLICFFGTSLIRFFAAALAFWSILWLADWVDPGASPVAVFFAAVLAMFLSSLLLPLAGFMLGLILFVLGAEVASALAGGPAHPALFFSAALLGGVLGVIRHREIARLTTALAGGWAAAYGLDHLIAGDPSVGAFARASLGLWDTHLSPFLVLAAAAILAFVGLKIQKKARETVLRNAATSRFGLDGWSAEQRNMLPAR